VKYAMESRTSLYDMHLRVRDVTNIGYEETGEEGALSRSDVVLLHEFRTPEDTMSIGQYMGIDTTNRKLRSLPCETRALYAAGTLKPVINSGTYRAP
jgi:hypothetical protein